MGFFCPLENSVGLWSIKESWDLFLFFNPQEARNSVLAVMEARGIPPASGTITVASRT